MVHNINDDEQIMQRRQRQGRTYGEFRREYMYLYVYRTRFHNFRIFFGGGPQQIIYILASTQKETIYNNLKKNINIHKLTRKHTDTHSLLTGCDFYIDRVRFPSKAIPSGLSLALSVYMLPTSRTNAKQLTATGCVLCVLEIRERTSAKPHTITHHSSRQPHSFVSSCIILLLLNNINIYSCCAVINDDCCIISSHILSPSSREFYTQNTRNAYKSTNSAGVSVCCATIYKDSNAFIPRIGILYYIYIYRWDGCQVQYGSVLRMRKRAPQLRRDSLSSSQMIYFFAFCATSYTYNENWE